MAVLPDDPLPNPLIETIDGVAMFGAGVAFRWVDVMAVLPATDGVATIVVFTGNERLGLGCAAPLVVAAWRRYLSERNPT